MAHRATSDGTLEISRRPEMKRRVPEQEGKVGLLEHQTQVVAHRGASQDAPENTLAAFAAALEMGCDVLELDVHLSEDGVLIVIHDEKVNRTTSARGRVDSFTCQHLRELDVPTLNEVLELVAGQAVVLIEVKASRPKAGILCCTCPIYETMAAKVVAIISAHKAAKWTIVQSFHLRYLQQINELDAEVECHSLAIMHADSLLCGSAMSVHWNLDGVHQIALADLRKMGIRSLNVSKWSCTSRFIQNVHEHNMKVYVWTVDDKTTMGNLFKWGADGIITNNPRMCLGIKQEYYNQ